MVLLHEKTEIRVRNQITALNQYSAATAPAIFAD